MFKELKETYHGLARKFPAAFSFVEMDSGWLFGQLTVFRSEVQNYITLEGADLLEVKRPLGLSKSVWCAQEKQFAAMTKTIANGFLPTHLDYLRALPSETAGKYSEKERASILNAAGQGRLFANVDTRHSVDMTIARKTTSVAVELPLQVINRFILWVNRFVYYAAVALTLEVIKERDEERKEGTFKLFV